MLRKKSHGIGRLSRSALWSIGSGIALSALGIAAIGRRGRGGMRKSEAMKRGLRQPVEIKKSFEFDAPIDKVFRFWTNYQNFPLFMRNIESMRELGDRRSRWRAAGPGGLPMEWEAEVTEKVPNRTLAWKSLPESDIDHHGLLRFTEYGTGTRVYLDMTYYPIAGKVGEKTAQLFGAGAQNKVEEDIRRMKEFLETGKSPFTGVESLTGVSRER